MSALAAEVPSPEEPQLTSEELAFIHTVLEHRGVFRRATYEEFKAAVLVLQHYRLQQDDRPGENLWAPILDGDTLAELQAKAFMMFGTVSPTAAQWHKAHTALYGPLLCATCE